MRDRQAWLAVLLAALLPACAMGPPRTHAALAAEPARGRMFAEQVCVACHAIDDEDVVSPNPAATPFEIVANTPGMTAIALNAWLHSAHPSMPNVAVSQDQTDDLWAYLLTLRDQR